MAGNVVESEAKRGKSRDILASPRLVLAWFCLPAVAIVVTASPRFGNGWRTAIWTVALTIMGGACAANARRCGRLHCYITGPFLLAMAVITLLHGLGVLRFGRNGWNAIGLTILVGAIALTCLPEMFFGKYRKDHAACAGHR